MKKLPKNKKIFLIVSVLLIAALVYFFFIRKKKIKVNYIKASASPRPSGTEISIPEGIGKAIAKGSITFQHPNYKKQAYTVIDFWVNPTGNGDSGTIFIDAPYAGTGTVDRQEAYILI